MSIEIDVLGSIDQAYIAQSNYWLTYFPYVVPFSCPRAFDELLYSLRGFLAVFDLAQIINLVWVSIKKRFVFPE